jgi:hypothetical protein
MEVEYWERAYKDVGDWDEPTSKSLTTGPLVAMRSTPLSLIVSKSMIESGLCVSAFVCVYDTYAALLSRLVCFA